jgi:hypothetical protein
MAIQSILFDKRRWTVPAAIAWLDSHNHLHYKVDITKNKLRFRQYPPKRDEHYRIIKLGLSGIEFVLGYPDGEYD